METLKLTAAMWNRMKIAAPIIRALAEGFEDLGCQNHVLALTEFAHLAEGQGSASSEAGAALDNLTMKEAIKPLVKLQVALELAGAKKATPGVANLLALLQRGDESDSVARRLTDLREAMFPPSPEEQVKSFAERLACAKGKEAEFEQTYAELQQAGLSREHIVKVARSVYGFVDARTSKKAALAYIRKLHDTFVKTRRSIDAQGGRSAA